MKKSSHCYRGFGLVEILVAMSILGVLMAGFGAYMNSAGRGASQLASKQSMIDMGNRLTYLGFDPKTCMSIFKNPLPDFDPANPPTLDVSLNIGGVEVAAGKTVDNLVFNSVKLRIGQEASPGSGRFFGDILLSGASNINAGPVNSKSSVLFKTDAAGTLRKITGCTVGGSGGGPDPLTTCEALGGRWLGSIGQCHWGGVLLLGQYQGIDASDIPPGARISECFTKIGGSGKTSVYNCPSRAGSVNVAQCVFAAGNLTSPNVAAVGNKDETDGWVAKKPTSSKVSRVCDAGITIRIPDTEELFLPSNEMVEDKFAPTAPTGSTGTSLGSVLTTQQLLENHDFQQDVVECFLEESGARSVKCDQSLPPNTAGRCEFVNGALAVGDKRAIDSAGQSEKYVNNYTGWIRIRGSNYLYTSGSGTNAKRMVRSAWGNKCYSVRAVKGTSDSTLRTAVVTDLKDPDSSSSTNLISEGRSDDVQECLFIGDADGGSNPTPILSVGINNIYSSPYTGRYLHRFRCTQTGIETDNLTGNGTDDPTLVKGACWYANDAIISNAFSKNRGVSIVSNKARFTGWVYLTADMPNNRYSTGTDFTITRLSNNNSALNAYPCNVGIRLSSSPSAP